MRYLSLLLLYNFTAFQMSFAQITSPLYPGEIPNSKNISSDLFQKNIPEITYYKASATPNGKAILIIPGGGYSHLAIQHEGHQIAQEFIKNGYTAFVLKYRLPHAETMVNKTIGPIQDAQTALQRIRTQDWGLPFSQVGVIGFSAGGHLAATLCTHIASNYHEPNAPVYLRPDFALLIYPVITMDSTYTHRGSRKQLLGDTPDSTMLQLFSADLQVSQSTPPTFLLHSQDDKVVPIENSALYKNALERLAIPHDLLIYPSGGHGYGLTNKTTSEQWFDKALLWISQNSQ